MLLRKFKRSWIYNILRLESIDVKCGVVKISKRFQQLAYIDMQWPDTNFLNEDKWKVFMYSLCLNGYHNGSIQAKMPVLIEVDIIYHTISMVYKLPIPVQYLYILHRLSDRAVELWFINLFCQPFNIATTFFQKSSIEW